MNLPDSQDPKWYCVRAQLRQDHEGAFRRLSAVITQLRPGAERVRVLLDFLGRKLEAEVSSEFVLSKTQHPLLGGN